MTTIKPNTRKRPWITKSKNTSSGFNGNNKDFYNSTSWRKYSIKYRLINRRCADCRKIQHDIKSLVVDHIIPISNKGSKWDDRNHQSLCKNPCHKQKSARESHNQILSYKLNKRNERIPD